MQCVIVLCDSPAEVASAKATWVDQEGYALLACNPANVHERARVYEQNGTGETLIVNRFGQYAMYFTKG